MNTNPRILTKEQWDLVSSTTAVFRHIVYQGIVEENEKRIKEKIQDESIRTQGKGANRSPETKPV